MCSLRKQLKRIERDVTQFKGTIDMWDVINEVVIMPEFDKYDNAITRICQEYGRVPLVKRVFDEAKAANPDSTLLLNDFNTSENYARLIDDSLQAGAPSGILRKDNSKKPAFLRLKELIKGEWWTDIEVRTDENGFVTVEGFKGEYDLVYETKRTSLSLLENSTDTETIAIK